MYSGRNVPMKWDQDPKYRQIGLTAFIVIAASMLFYFFIFRMSTLGSALETVFSVLNPIIYGYIIAYILIPQETFIENITYKLIHKTAWNPSKSAKKAIRLICTILAVAIAVFLIYGLMSIVIPELLRSIRSIVNNVPEYANTINAFIDNTFQNNAEFDEQTTSLITEYAGKIQDWFIREFNPMVNSIANNVTNQVVSVVTFFRNLLLGLVISIYIMCAREAHAARFKRLIYSLFSIQMGNRILFSIRFIDEKFGGFIIGKFIDSAIIGLITYVCCSIMNMPYTLLISVVIGVTNVIPFFGPFLGAIPCVFLIFVTSPIKSLIFIIFILILQQIDGNVIGPRILGDSVGVSSYLVILAILIGGGFFGVTGMIIGVPCAAVIVAVMQSRILRRMKEKGLPGDIESYHYLREINPNNKEIITNDFNDEEKGIYDLIRKRDEIVTSYDEPLEENSWDMTMDQIEEEDALINGTADYLHKEANHRKTEQKEKVRKKPDLSESLPEEKKQKA